MTDSQICVTGKCLIGESFIKATKRELSEEIGFTHDLNVKESCTKTKGKYTYKTYCFCINDLIPYIGEDHSEVIDDHTKRVQIFIWGTKEDCLKKMKDVRTRMLSLDASDLAGVMIMPIKEILTHYS